MNKGIRIKSFAIWKNQEKEFFKDSGMPGWHIECFSIINSSFSKQENGYMLEIHAGGIDLLDIHNNCEIIHYYLENKDYMLSKIWLHIHLVLLDNKKISKRYGNIISLNEMLDKMSISAFMILMLGTSYQKNININNSSILQAQNRYKKIVKNFLHQVILLYDISNSYTLLNFINEIVNTSSKNNVKIIEETELNNNLNTVRAINMLQSIKIKNRNHINDFYTIDSVLNTQILQSIYKSLITNIDKEYFK